MSAITLSPARSVDTYVKPTMNPTHHEEPAMTAILTTTTLALPIRFWDDHADRDCVQQPEITREVRRTKSKVYVELSDVDVAELLSDANYYATSVQDLDRSLFGLCMSAKATETLLRKTFTAEQLADFRRQYRDFEVARQEAWRKATEYTKLVSDLQPGDVLDVSDDDEFEEHTESIVEVDDVWPEPPYKIDYSIRVRDVFGNSLTVQRYHGLRVKLDRHSHNADGSKVS